jgi:FkbM family methyltransferase
MKIDWYQWRSFLYGTWEPEVVKTLTEAVQPGSCAVDIGAHIGFYTLVLSRLVGAKGTVISFEPMPETFNVLVENIRLNQCGQVQTINKAVMDRSCELRVGVSSQDPLPGSASVISGSASDTLNVQAVSLDDFMQEQPEKADFIKMDVEGAESLVLVGAKRTVEATHPNMLIEIHHFDGSPPERSPALRQLCDWGYRTRWIDRNPLTSHVLATWEI